MARSKSIEKISKYPPSKIIKVSLEKAQQCITESEKDLSIRDYKKIKYWLKIAQNVCEKVERLDEFNEFLGTVRTNHTQNDQKLKQLLSEAFPVPVKPN